MTISPQTMDLNQDHRPQNMIFSKMEKIIQDMQLPDTGIPVRCQKIFLTTIPCAFTGYDLIEWLMERLEIQDSAEAIHLGNLLCHYGYIFPVTDNRTLSVKDDNSLYRFQSPYFWPSKNWNPDNVDYAIYLAKRTMRNKQRHGLDEHEQVAFNKLQKMLCDKWEFIYMQAEEQVRLAKERKKADKVVVDSQEKAFWRIHRPGPGQIKTLEEGMKKNLRSTESKKKKSLEFVKKEYEFFKHSVTIPRMKTSKVVECLISRTEMYAEHDLIIVGALPSNPWITDDTTLWILVETPTERRVKRWAFGLHELLRDPTGRNEFEIYLKKEYSQENIRFWQACEELKQGKMLQIPAQANEIYREFLAPGAPCEINIDCKTMELTQHNLKNPTRYTFDAAQEHIFTLMKKDSYQRFLRSDHYKNLLATALQPSSKKKFFNFGTGKKKTPVPSPQPKRRGSTSSERNSDGSSVKGSTSGIVGHQHSYSTGNLQELDFEQKPTGNVFRIASPSTLRKKLDSLVKRSSGESPQKTSLEVPAHYPVRAQEEDDDESETNDNVAINVPCINEVAPWDDESLTV
ncbi:regulator of G-protein signaling 7-like isoform X2 [Lineus longissimus]|uniref:regulator of G-protein signaling 7-like isoform X2 n=1 Tax=Lineus longissimus TaxID=88925 RepID=UPI002B4E42FC